MKDEIVWEGEIGIDHLAIRRDVEFMGEVDQLVKMGLCVEFDFGDVGRKLNPIGGCLGMQVRICPQLVGDGLAEAVGKVPSPMALSNEDGIPEGFGGPRSLPKMAPALREGSKAASFKTLSALRLDFRRA
ncbi:MAG: hypothetical protein U0176_14880 [Bacteroidia bacterium]